MNKLVVIAALVIISIIPAILLYYLFGELNAAGVQWAGKQVQLGGPVAAFFAVLLFCSRLYSTLSAPSLLQKQLQNLAGTWTIEATSHGPSRRKAQSSTVMTSDGSTLSIKGGTFRDPPSQGGAVIGDWSAEIAVFDGYNLLYVYNLLDNKSEAWKGVVRAALGTKARTPTFDGTWQVFGKEVHTGEIHMAKQLHRELQ